jgi:hypothetical protein
MGNDTGARLVCFSVVTGFRRRCPTAGVEDPFGGFGPNSVAAGLSRDFTAAGLGFGHVGGRAPIGRRREFIP